MSLLKKLLPPGLAFKNTSVQNLAHSLEKPIAACKQHIKLLFEEVPSKHMDLSLNLWRKIFDLDEPQEIAAKFSATGGQSKEYLEEVLDQLKQDDESPTLHIDQLNQKMVISGLNVSVDSFRLNQAVKRPLNTSIRNESLIRGFESIKHAQVEARYCKQWTE